MFASTPTTPRMPVVFVSHGAPTFALEPGLAGPRLAALGQQHLNRETVPGLQAILVVSAHWLTRGGIAVASTQTPDTVHDFGGFPRALYDIRYPAPGAPDAAQRAVAVLEQAGLHARLDANRGLDHGAWVPLLHMVPDADIPVFQVSLPWPATPADAFALGRALAPLRDQGIAILASGSLTHNLGDIRWQAGEDAIYATAFAEWIGAAVARGDVAGLIDYRARAPYAERAHPSDDHLLPLHVALGAASLTSATPHDAITVIDGGMTYGVLSMDAYVFAPTPTAASLSPHPA
ncbi:class III extradiol ring-cleavage dioxygenase [Robbsia sp. KACC 23696]|uniref:dioxygenase family protein n=1 Tax=Robbsia sp. KACC 23696 TaxID=3149231 RepID=UPI00325A9DC1